MASIASTRLGRLTESLGSRYAFVRKFESEESTVSVPILYSGTRNASSWAMRAWLALREADIEFVEVTDAVASGRA